MTENRNDWYHIWQSYDESSRLSPERLAKSFKALESVFARQADRKIRRWKTVAAIAACLAAPLVFLSVYLMSNLHESEQYANYIQVYVPKGKTETVVLPDSSVVQMNSDTYLMYPEKFGKTRKIFLNGEAYLDVSKDARKEFVVRAKSVDIVVHGTSFNVRSYGDESYTETRLYEGSVSVCFDGQDILLQPGQQVTVDNSTMKSIAAQSDVNNSMTSNDGSYIFRNKGLDEITSYLEKIFNVRILICDAELLHKKYFVAFTSDLSLEEMLSALNFKSEMSVTKTEEGVIELHRKD